MLDQLESLLRQHGVQIRNATPPEKADARCLVQPGVPSSIEREKGFEPSTSTLAT